MEDLIRILDDNPEWADALRGRLLTKELIELPERFTQFVAEMNSFVAEVHRFVEATNRRFDALENSVASIQDDVVVTSSALSAADRSRFRIENPIDEESPSVPSLSRVRRYGRTTGIRLRNSEGLR